MSAVLGCGIVCTPCDIRLAVHVLPAIARSQQSQTVARYTRGPRRDVEHRSPTALRNGERTVVVHHCRTLLVMGRGVNSSFRGRQVKDQGLERTQQVPSIPTQPDHASTKISGVR